MDLFHCGNQWGYTPMGRVSSIPGGYCNPPTGLTATVRNQYVTLKWVAPHDYLYFELNYRKVGDVSWTSVVVYGISYLATLDPLSDYEWRVRAHCEVARFSSWANGTNFTTGILIAGCTAVSAVTIALTFDDAGNPVHTASWASTGATHYILTVYGVGNDTIEFTVKVSGTSYVLPAFNDYGVECFEVAVAAVCPDLTITAESPRVLYCPNRLCPTCRNLTHTAGSNSIAFSWFMPAEFKSVPYTYNIYLDNVLIVSGFPDTVFTITGLNPDTEYTIGVRVNCESSYSDIVTSTVKTKAVACNEPSALITSNITATDVDLDWTPGAGITGQELIINNGTPIVLGAGITSYSITGQPSGSVLDVRIRSVCSGTATPGISTIVNLSGCATVTGLTLTVNTSGLTVTWDAVANAGRYVFQMDVDGGGYVEYETAGNTFNLPNPVLGSIYSVKVAAVCKVGGQEVQGAFATGSVTINTNPSGNCSNYTISGVKYVNATTVGFTIAEAQSGKFGTDIRLLITADGDPTTVIDTKIVYTPGYYELENLVAGTAYDIYAYPIVNESYDPLDPETDGCDIHTPYDYDHDTCWAMTAANFNCTFAGTTLTFDLQTTSFTVDQTNLDLYWLQEGSDDWSFVANLAIPGGYPYAINGVERARYKFKVVVYCGTTPMEEVISDWICIDTPDIVPVINGTTVQFQEVTPTEDVYSYKVLLTSISKGTNSLEMSRDNMQITGLSPNTIYTAELQLICSTNPEVLGSTKTVTFITGNESQVICGPADFSSIIQDCEIEDPGGGSGGGTGGGETGPIVCGLKPMSWDVVSSLFVKDPANDLSNNYYIEMVLSINNSQSNGAEVLMPGGVAAGIENSACFPAASSVLDVEIVSGATSLVAASAAIGDDGNITITGSYTTNGASTLILRLKGIYNL